MNRMHTGALIAAFATSLSTGALVSAAQQTGQAGQGAPPAAQSDASTGQSASGPAGFVNEMTAAGLAEITLGELATKRASNDEVKAFGQMMVKDHTLANNELGQIASGMQIQPSAQLDQKHRELADRLAKLSGDEFDREFMTAMVEDHQLVISRLQARAGTSTSATSPDAAHDAAGHTASPAAQPPSATGTAGAAGASTTSAAGTAGTMSPEAGVTGWAVKTLPIVQQHLQRARDLQQKIAK